MVVHVVLRTVLRFAGIFGRIVFGGRGSRGAGRGGVFCGAKRAIFALSCAVLRLQLVELWAAGLLGFELTAYPPPSALLLVTPFFFFSHRLVTGQSAIPGQSEKQGEKNRVRGVVLAKKKKEKKEIRGPAVFQAMQHREEVRKETCK